MRSVACAALLVGLLAVSGCAPAPAPASEPAPETLAPFSDVRVLWEPVTLAEGSYRAEDMVTLRFNEKTVFEGNAALQAALIEAGKNPGLGVRALGAAGITGRGVNVGIIDQNLLLDHPEFAGKIVEYYDTGCGTDPEQGSMHGPAVTSLLVGETLGVAPDARVYYAAAPSWVGDARYYAEGLDWLIAQNEALPEGEEIRVVSVSANPSGESFEKNRELWAPAVARAQAAGMVVLDARDDAATGIVEHGYYDPEAPDDLSRFQNGWVETGENYPTGEGHISVPCDFRTQAEQYLPKEYGYQYGGSGGLSWGIPYASGVLALGWQVAPQLDGPAMVEILRSSAYQGERGERVINPAAFLEAVRAAGERA